jgi:hypothetical protein
MKLYIFLPNRFRGTPLHGCLTLPGSDLLPRLYESSLAVLARFQEET